ncbi:helix-turn-helix transcriptional regulator [Methylobacterium sp. J-072]|uniref:helix-turn-helix domain-containing protein n=1 Tax=Methylobacterium sp. J-072 TaxID=2836651 RepID=UPI001FBB43C9|nr:helix-turn-helix transcriptional regulator [Methylobacterium sp. J-072]MCJ2093605.1 helix-turn-helix transcriptional regulator [Methylobacterium sp. J-072]
MRRLRVERGIPQESLAVDAGVDRTYVSGIERREFNPSVDLLDRLATALAVDILDLLAVPACDKTAPSPLPAGRKRR